MHTGYVTDPEECIADNFAYAMLYGMKDNDGNGYPNPEIIQGIILSADQRRYIWRITGKSGGGINKAVL